MPSSAWREDFPGEYHCRFLAKPEKRRLLRDPICDEELAKAGVDAEFLKTLPM